MFHDSCDRETDCHAVNETKTVHALSGQLQSQGCIITCILPCSLLFLRFLNSHDHRTEHCATSMRYLCFHTPLSCTFTPQWGAADAEIKVPSGENIEFKCSPFKGWSRSVYSHTCYAYCQGFLPCLFLPFRSIHIHFFQNLFRFLLCWPWLTHGSCVGPQNKIGHPAGCRFPC